VDVAAYVKVLRRRYWVLLILVLTGAFGGYAVGHAKTPEYSATSRSFVEVPTNGTLAEQYAGSQLSISYVATYARIATSLSVAQRVVALLHLPLSAGEVQGQLSSSVESDTVLVDITATDPDPTRAAAIANAAGAALHAVSETLDTNATPVTTQVIDTASVPGSPNGPGPSRDLSLGIIFGVVVGAALIALLEALDRTVKSTVQATNLSGAPAVGLLPRRRGGLGAATQDATHDVASEAYRALRTAVRFLNPDAPLRTVLVTSASPGDGKTTTAANLAIALARGGDRVIIVDADLRRSGLSTFFGIESAVGVTTVLRRQVRLKDALQTWAPNLRILPAGTLPINPAELLGSQAMARLLDQLAVEADVVVIDSPPVLPVTDAVVLGTSVDGVLLVVRHGKTLRRSVQEATRRITAVGAEVAGVVLNGLPVSEAREYYVDYVYQEVGVPKRTRPTPGLPVDQNDPDNRDEPAGVSP
jgi:capsular exopolysaccharide synthesis family protein